MRVWFVIFFFLFALVELFQWAKEFFLPLPIYVLAGAFLAIASNNDKGIGSWLRQESRIDDEVEAQNTTLINPVHPIVPSVSQANQSLPPIEPQPELMPEEGSSLSNLD